MLVGEQQGHFVSRWKVWPPNKLQLIETLYYFFSLPLYEDLAAINAEKNTAEATATKTKECCDQNIMILTSRI